jgi:glucan phosphoethanolaminetransferase (alkaline phosphatase superfamily)
MVLTLGELLFRSTALWLVGILIWSTINIYSVDTEKAGFPTFVLFIISIFSLKLSALGFSWSVLRYFELNIGWIYYVSLALCFGTILMFNAWFAQRTQDFVQKKLGVSYRAVSFNFDRMRSKRKRKRAG